MGYGLRVLFDRLLEVLDPEPHSAAFNMALDEILLLRAEMPLLRLYRWKQAAVSFGYFERHADVMEAWPGREWVRRWTGGGVVPHGEDLTYTLIIPRSCQEFDPVAANSYRAIHEPIAAILGEGSQGGSVVLAGAPGPKKSVECFANAVEHDLVVGAQKVAGAAQRRTRAGLLHQGSVQNCAGLQQVRERLAEAFSERVVRRVLMADEVAEAERLAVEKYASEAWMRRF